MFRVFISYAHEDSGYKDELIKFLTPLVHSQQIKIWHDKEIKAGDIFDDVIIKHLDESDIVIFLISQNFLTSNYCRNIEQQLALDKYQNDGLSLFRIVPIVVTPCTFNKSPLNKFNVPLKAKPISTCNDQNQAFVEIHDSIEELITELSCLENKYIEKSKVALAYTEEYKSEHPVREAFLAQINDLGFTIQHSKKDHILLSDLYVNPEFKKLEREIENYDIFTPSEAKTSPEYLFKKKLLIIADEQSGKTTLAKVIFKKNIGSQLIPVIIKGEEFKSSSEPIDVVQKGFFEQYEHDVFPQSKILLIIDDISESQINERFKKLLIKNINKNFDSVVIISDTKIRYQEQLMHEFGEYEKYEIIPLSYKKRTELVEKWSSIGFEESGNISEQQQINDGLQHSIEAILMKNIVPSKPIFILMILQILETNTPNNFALTSYGHCYHSLIVDAFKRANIRLDQLNDYFNYLSELAFFIYECGNSKIDETRLDEFKEWYSENYIIKSHDEVFGKLERSRLIQFQYGTCRFQYKYIFYFFVAKKISELESVEDEIDRICDLIHTEKHANILIFITHHTKDKKIIERIVSKLSAIFDGRNPAKLDKDEVKFLNEVADLIPQMVLDNSKDVEDERNKIIEREDAQEKEQYISDSYSDDEEEEEDVDAINSDLIDVNRSCKAVEILGQIIRNRKGSMTKDQLDTLGSEAFSVGLRFLDYYFSITRTLKDELIEEIQRLIEKKKNWSKERITKEAKLYYWHFSYIMSLNVIRKIALSVGHKDLVDFYHNVSGKMDSEVSQIIDINIELEFRKTIPKDKILKLWGQLKDNLITRRLLQEILIQHLHLHYVKHDDKHWISSTLEIPTKDQNSIQRKRHVLNNASPHLMKR